MQILHLNAQFFHLFTRLFVASSQLLFFHTHTHTHTHTHPHAHAHAHAHPHTHTHTHTHTHKFIFSLNKVKKT